jgi:hypothetical protein
LLSKRALRSPAISVSSSGFSTLTGIIHFGHIGHHFQRIQRPARIAVDQLRNRKPRLVRQNDILPAIARALSSIA